MDFPDDDNGDVLRRLVRDGDDLTRPRDVDFVVVFADVNQAEVFATHFRDLGFKVSVERTEVETGLPWDVIVVNNMIPTHEGIGRFEELLDSVAAPLGGRNDGWGALHRTLLRRTRRSRPSGNAHVNE
jgi:hypothetical protein